MIPQVQWRKKIRQLDLVKIENVVTGGMTQWLRVLAALVEDPGSSAPISWLATVYNSSCMDLMASSDLLMGHVPT